MTDRPSFLILVTGKNGLELFSAHHTADDASVTRDRLDALLRSTGSQVHLIEVPEVDGVAKSTKPAAPALVVSPATPPAPAPSIPIPATQEEFEEQTKQMLRSNGPRDGYRDDKYVGAFS